MSRRTTATAAAVATAALLLAGCGGDGASAGSAASGVDAATATSAEDFGGFDALVEAAEAEGELNVIALPESWANYGEIIALFEEKYDITVTSADPDVSSAEEIQAAENLRGQDTAPDVFDLGTAVALDSLEYFAPYQVETWDEIPDENKEPTGLWTNNYTGVMSVGYDADAVPAPTTLEDLLGEEYRGKVALNGDPTQAGAAAAGVVMAALHNGGSLDDIQPGIDFFAELNDVGNFLPLDPTPATIASGETPVVIDWSYTNLAEQENNEGMRDWQVTILPGPAVGSYYNEAINVDAPHPAAARLWVEHIFSDDVQNRYLDAGAFPVRLQAMIDAGTADEAALEASGGIPEDLQQQTPEQTEAASALLAEQWASAVS